MPQMNRDDARHFFYWPFYEAEQGYIIGLATTSENMRDGLAIAQMARFFPLPEYEKVVVEPGREGIRPERNVIVVGWGVLFIDSDSDSYSVSGHERPARVGKEKLERIVRLYKRCCFRITEKNGERVVVNKVTNREFAPSKPRPGRKGFETDFGIVRRWFPNRQECTIVVEGPHRLGTLGAAKVATSLLHLGDVVEALRRLDDYDDQLPLEILVRTEFHHDNDDIYSLDRITAEPLMIVYNGQWVYDLREDRYWFDQLPFDVNVFAAEQARARPVPHGSSHKIVPRLELSVDLREDDEQLRKLCRELLSNDSLKGAWKTPPAEEAAMGLLDMLASRSEQFSVELWEVRQKGAAPTRTPLHGGPSPIRQLRKRFLIHMLLYRMLGLSLPCPPELIRRIYSTYKPKLVAKTKGDRAEELVRTFIGAVPGRLREGFEGLLGPSKRRKNYLHYPCKRRKEADGSVTRTYPVTLENLMLVLKLRI